MFIYFWGTLSIIMYDSVTDISMFEFFGDKVSTCTCPDCNKTQNLLPRCRSKLLIKCFQIKQKTNICKIYVSISHQQLIPPLKVSCRKPYRLSAIAHENSCKVIWGETKKMFYDMYIMCYILDLVTLIRFCSQLHVE